MSSPTKHLFSSQDALSRALGVIDEYGSDSGNAGVPGLSEGEAPCLIVLSGGTLHNPA